MKVQLLFCAKVSDFTGQGGNSGVIDARISLTKNNQAVNNGVGRTGSDGRLTYNDLEKGFYDYEITTDKHKKKSGEIYVSAGITREEKVFLDIPVVNVNWSVTETVIEDEYDIVIDATYETNVPTPVIVIEPSVIVIPRMAVGESITGALKVSNYGLIAMDDVTSSLPQTDAYLRYEFNTDALPDKILPLQSVYLPYRVTQLSALEYRKAKFEVLEGITQKNNALDSVLKESGNGLNIPEKRATCSRVFGYHKVGRVKCDYTCSNGDKRNTSSSVQFVHTGPKQTYTCNTPKPCSGRGCIAWGGGGGGGLGGGNGGGGGGGSGPSIPPGITPCAPNEPCKDCCQGGGPGGGPGGPSPGPDGLRP